MFNKNTNDKYIFFKFDEVASVDIKKTVLKED